jgi:hypothetical protein
MRLQNEIVAAIRGIDYSAVFYLTPRPGRTAADQRCNGDACDVARQWVIHRISPHFSGGEVKADNLALVDIDLDCDVDVVSVDENFGDKDVLALLGSNDRLTQLDQLLAR